jgi:hypothetical protein
MSAPRNYDWPQWRFSCTCLDEEGQALLIRESCGECASDRAAAHLALGHSPSLRAPFPDLPPDKATNKLLGGRRG